MLHNVNYIQPIQGETDETKKARYLQMNNANRREKYKRKKWKDRENNINTVSTFKFPLSHIFSLLLNINDL